MLAADGNAPLASSAAAPPRSLKLSDNTPTLIPEPLTARPLALSACCTCGAVAPPLPTCALASGPSAIIGEPSRLATLSGCHTVSGIADAAAAGLPPEIASAGGWTMPCAEFSTSADAAGSGPTFAGAAGAIEGIAPCHGALAGESGTAGAVAIQLSAAAVR